jgi:hypothetical protein
MSQLPLSRASVETQIGRSLELALVVPLPLPPQPLEQQPGTGMQQLQAVQRIGLQPQEVRLSGVLQPLLVLSSSGNLMPKYSWTRCKRLFHSRINIDGAL